MPTLSNRAVLASRAALLAIILVAASPRAATTEPAGRPELRRTQVPGAEATRRWAIRTHMFLAEELLKDLLPDGKITIYRTNYHAGTVDTLQPLGEFDVDPLVLAALRTNPAAFRAGVMAGDAYPDIITGQSVIHPSVARQWSSNSIDGHDAWLRHLWEMSRLATTPPAARAFVAGVLLHSAGDMYGHTFVNHFTGREFTLPPKDAHNAKNHLLIDTYVGVRTKDVIPYRPGKPEEPIRPSDVSIVGVEDFIYNMMINAKPGSTLDTALLTGIESQKSIPRIYSDIHKKLGEEIAWYSQVIADYNRDIKAKYDAAIARGCKQTEVVCSDVIANGLRLDAHSIEALRTAHMAVQGPIRDYKVQWRKQIEIGLKALPRYSEYIVLALLYPIAPQHGLGAAKNIAEQYVRLHFLAMAGAPPEVGQTLQIVDQTIKEVVDAIIPVEVKAMLDEIARVPLDFMLKVAVGMTATQVEQYVTAPQTHFDKEMSFNPTAAGKITLAQMNQRELKLQDAGFQPGPDGKKPAEYLVYTKVPPLYNSYVLSQLSLLSRAAMNQLLAQLGVKEPTSQDFHIMLGFMPSIDGGNQWHGGSENGPRMVLAYDCNAYTQIFMKQTGEAGDNSCVSWTPPQQVAQAAATPQAAVGGVAGQRVAGAQRIDVLALQRQAIAARPLVRPRPVPVRVNPADAAFRLTMPVVERWSKTARVIARSPLAPELARDRGEPLTPAVDALAAALARVQSATAVLSAQRIPPRDFALAHVTVLRAVAAQRDPALAKGVSAENVRFVAGQKAALERLLRDAGVAGAMLAAAR